MAFAPPPPNSNGHSGALRLRKKCPKPSGQGSRPPQNQVNSSQKSCPKPSGQGLRPPSPYGQCPNAPCMNLSGASLKGHIRVPDLMKMSLMESRIFPSETHFSLWQCEPLPQALHAKPLPSGEQVHFLQPSSFHSLFGSQSSFSCSPPFPTGDYLCQTI